MENNLIVKCPHCGREYLLCEIVYPNSLLGYATDIERDIYGKIIYHNSNEISDTESYTCDECRKPFKVKTKIICETSKDTTNDFEVSYSTPLYGDRLILKEN